jgi:hypothetical protein
VNTNNEGVAEFVFGVKPDTLIPIFDTRDTGNIVLQLLKQPTKYFGKRILAASEYISFPQMVETYKKGKY